MSASFSPSAPDLAGRTFLVVFAHPDDESIACGGTLARLADAGARVVLICASRGEKGSISDRALLDGHELGSVRARELHDAASVLGISEVVLYEHPDGDLRWAEVPQLHVEIVLAIQKYRPDAVITFGEDGLYWHLDHIGVHERTYTAVKSFGPYAPPLYYVTMPPDVMRPLVDAATARGWEPPEKGFWSLTPDAFGLGAEPPTIVLNVKDWVGRKLAALRCHRSQTSSADPLGQIDDQQAQRWFGVEHFHRAAIMTSGDPVLERLDSYAS